MEAVLGGLISVAGERRWDVGPADRFCTAFTPLLLIAAFLVVSLKVDTAHLRRCYKASLEEYAMDPIQCWCPAQFTKGEGWEQYVENYCFVENTYFLMPNESIPDRMLDRESRMISYYQWVPFFFVAQALMFYLPVQLWRVFQRLSGLNVNGIVGSAAEGSEMASEVALHLYRKAEVHSARPPPIALISVAYVSFKLILFANIFAQFYLMKQFFGLPLGWGQALFESIWEKSQWMKTGHFPRTTMCDFKVRHLGNVEQFTVQCVLMVNMLNEKLMIFIFWWLVVLAAVCLLSLAREVYALLAPQRSRRLLLSLLHTPGEGVHRRAAFAASVLGANELFTLRMLVGNVGDVIAADVVRSLWTLWKADDVGHLHATNHILS